jgi:hypothetical protein
MTNSLPASKRTFVRSEEDDRFCNFLGRATPTQRNLAYERSQIIACQADFVMQRGSDGPGADGINAHAAAN